LRLTKVVCVSLGSEVITHCGGGQVSVFTNVLGGSWQ